MAIGIVLANPDKNSVQPSIFRRSRLNLLASSKPAPNPIAPRVAAIRAISGTVTLFGSEIFIITASPDLTSDRPPWPSLVIASHFHRRFRETVASLQFSSERAWLSPIRRCEIQRWLPRRSHRVATEFDDKSFRKNAPIGNSLPRFLDARSFARPESLVSSLRHRH